MVYEDTDQTSLFAVGIEIDRPDDGVAKSGRLDIPMSADVGISLSWHS